MIPEAAVEAAARATWQGGTAPGCAYEDIPDAAKQTLKDDVREILEAAAPHMGQPRRITTAEELDVLPIGSVVLSERYHSDVDGTAISFQRWYDGDWHRGGRCGDTHPDNFLPVTVLHEPGGAL